MFGSASEVGDVPRHPGTAFGLIGSIVSLFHFFLGSKAHVALSASPPGPGNISSRVRRKSSSSFKLRRPDAPFQLLHRSGADDYHVDVGIMAGPRPSPVGLEEAAFLQSLSNLTSCSR